MTVFTGPINTLPAGAAPQRTDTVPSWQGNGVSPYTRGVTLSQVFSALVSGDITTALGFTPYNNTNPSGYQTAAQVATSVGIETTRAEAAEALLTPLTTASRGQYKGTNTNDNATAGNIGEYVSSTVLIGSAAPLTTATFGNVTSISLTAGDWDVWGNVGLVPAGTTTYTGFYGGAISTTSGTPNVSPNGGANVSFANDAFTGVSAVFVVGQMRISLASTTTVYLLAVANFGVSTMGAYGFIGARRAR